jgi:peptide/nickel transport system ATP-binding protein
MSASGNILEVQNLKTHFFTKRGVIRAVDGVSYSVKRGEILGVVGESGSGKSVTAFSIMGLVDPPGRIVSGSAIYNGRNLIDMPPAARRKLRGSSIAMVFQNPLMTLNPVLRIDTQMVEAIRAHRLVGRGQARQECIQALEKVGIPSPRRRLKNYPHQLSGGMRQRVAIAIALLNRPGLIIADEPTTALDVTIQAQILFEMKKLCRQEETALIWITHDLTVVAGLAHRVCVMYAGKIMEIGAVDAVLDSPLHPYTTGLIGSVPSRNRRGRALKQIPGLTPSLLGLGESCAFKDRCARSSVVCDTSPPMREIDSGHWVRCHHPATGFLEG